MKKQETPPPEALSDAEMASLQIWARAKYKGLITVEIRELIEECLDWHRANGRGRVDWIATCRNWIRKEQRFKRNRMRGQNHVDEANAKRQALKDAAPVLDLFASRIGRKI